MRIAIHQPQYFMWLGLLDKMLEADFFVYLDNVQFNRRWYQHRALYATLNGPKYLTIPVTAPNHQIDGVEIRAIGFAEAQDRVLHKHFETLRHRYASTPGWKRSQESLRAFFYPAESYGSVCEMIIASMRKTLELFEVEIKFAVASELGATGAKDELMLDITRRMGGDTYYSGSGATAYMRDDIFREAGVKVEYQQFAHPRYPQSHGGAFVEGCSALDFYFEDPEVAKTHAHEVLARRGTSNLQEKSCEKKSLSTEEKSATGNLST